jgi:serine/threonine protein kinase
MLGTMDYLAPELIRGEDPSAASDVYAFGCLVYASGSSAARAAATIAVHVS